MPTLILLALLAADPTPEQLKLLATFKDEFVTIKTEGSNLRPYSIAKYEVPQDLWEAVMGSNPSRWKGPRNSVEMLNHAEALEFCSRATDLMRAAGLIEKTQTVRLPTEGQWDWAARARTTTKYSFGDDPAELGDYAWFTGNAKGNDPPVGAKKPNLWGLYDVHGYLWEWTDAGVLRSGSWKDPAEMLTTASRRVVDHGLRDDAVGLRCVLVAAQAASTTANVAEFKPTAQEKFVPAGSKLEMLWDQGGFTEGPAIAPDGSILFSDIGNAIYRYDPKTGKTAVFRQPSGRSNGLMFDQQGRLIACEGANTGGGRQISITTGIAGGKDGEVKTLADKYDGKRFNSPNDLAIDSQGRVYFTDPRYVGDEPRELDFEGVFLVGTDGSVKVATHEAKKPNGILVAPDGKTVYVSENNPAGRRQLLAFAVQTGGTLADKRVLWDFGTGRGIDGMTLDVEGNIFATAGTGDKAGIYVFAPDGKNLAFLPTPGDPTNCCFGGGDEAGVLYVTCANAKTPGTKYGLYRIKLKGS